MDNPDYSPARIADRLQITDAMYKWCRAIDRLDPEGMSAAFHPEAMDHHGPYNGPVDGLVQWVCERHQGIPFSSHQVSNILIEFTGADTAFVETYIRTIQRYPAESKASLSALTGGADGTAGRGSNMFTSSRYLDQFERRDGTWRIAARTLVHDWKQILDIPDNAPVALPEWTLGRRDMQDPVYLQRAALGLK